MSTPKQLLTIRDVADALGLSEATVSRCIAATETHAPTPDQIIAARRARQAAEARNAELSLAAWEHECADRAQQNLRSSK